ncbi:MAG: hypothetical protein J0I84_04680 [Terrimonas sp.]|nr:hypothetical protein [Terrimonas sp.]OJY99096.1 MAG: hypothetical protein BGP13_23910 [Sphingobacteriales bacterium 40-81]
MNDTPEHIKALQLKIWLSKPPEERLKQFMTDNDALMQFWKNAKDHLQEVHHETKPFFGEDCESCDK